jgi:AraC family transcriptional regulator of adaptative response/methylated-DNA-[protein]-cysteine methyltransferase
MHCILPARLQAATLVQQDPRWQAILRRDKAWDGKFWYSVASTGVYCRPSCPSRACNPENVTIHDTLEAAKETGCRACLRCRPEEIAPATAIVARACRLIEAADAPPSLKELAAAAGLSPFHFHRLFKAGTGVTPRAYAAAHRAARLRENLCRGQTITQAIFDAGFNSSGSFYADSNARLGMTPKVFRAGGANEVLHFAIGECALGSILVASSAKGIAAILIANDPEALIRELQDSFPKAELAGGDAGFEGLVARVVGLVEGQPSESGLPLDIRGTAFQQRVWQALRQIPAGETVSYTELAKRIGAPNSVRAVAGACAANKLAVAIPCHRVVRNEGAISGYRWGVERKRLLLEMEAARVQSAEAMGMSS